MNCFSVPKVSTIERFHCVPVSTIERFYCVPLSTIERFHCIGVAIAPAHSYSWYPVKPILRAFENLTHDTHWTGAVEGGQGGLQPLHSAEVRGIAPPL